MDVPALIKLFANNKVIYVNGQVWFFFCFFLNCEYAQSISKNTHIKKKQKTKKTKGDSERGYNHCRYIPRNTKYTVRLSSDNGERFSINFDNPNTINGYDYISFETL